VNNPLPIKGLAPANPAWSGTHLSGLWGAALSAVALDRRPATSCSKAERSDSSFAMCVLAPRLRASLGFEAPVGMHPEHGADAAEGVSHYRDRRAVAQAQRFLRAAVAQPDRAGDRDAGQQRPCFTRSPELHRLGDSGKAIVVIASAPSQ
jgi:hypothetical protein